MENVGGRKIMVALEESEKDIYALEWALNYLVPRPCYPPTGPDHFVILYVTTQSLSNAVRTGDAFGTSRPLDALEDRHKDIIDRVKHACEKHDVTYEIKTVVGEAKLVICEAAKTLGVDILVISNHNHRGLKRLFSWSSVGDYCVQNVRCPVVVVKGRQKPI